jgi:hypothetical protein
MISITSKTLQPGDEGMVARRLKEILQRASERARGVGYKAEQLLFTDPHQT